MTTLPLGAAPARAVLIVLYGALALGAAARADAQLLRGRVIDDNTEAPVTGASVMLRDGGGRYVATATVDSLGVFLLQPTAPGSFTLHVAHVAYRPYVSETIGLNRNEVVEATVRVSASAIPLQPLVVHARRSMAPGKLGDFERRRAQGVGYFITRADIEQRPMATATSLLRNIPGVRLQPAVRRGREQSFVQFAGTGVDPCPASIYVDGALISQSAASVDAWLDPQLLAGVEVYTRASSAPTEYARSNCGVVLFWTREAELRPARGRFRWLIAGAAAVGMAVLFLVN